MSYNISSWQLKELTDLVIPLSTLYEQGDRHFSAPQLNIGTGAHTLYGMGGTVIEGAISENLLHVQSITICGEGSGTTMEECLEGAFSKSTGILRAVLVWERGDSIERLTVINGEVTRREIELE